MKNVNLQDTAKTKTAEDVRQRYNLDVIKSMTSKQTSSGCAIGIGKKAAVSKGLDITGEIVTDDKITAANGFYDKNGARLSPPGMSFDWENDTIPIGYLEKNGAAVSRTTYADLFTVIGTKFGIGDGSTTFNLPNDNGRVSVGYDSTQTEFNTVGKTGGAKTHTLTVGEMPTHAHPITFTRYSSLSYYYAYPPYTSGEVVSNCGSTDNNGGGGAHNNLQPYIVKRKIIKY